MIEDNIDVTLRVCVQAHIPVFLVSEPGTTKSKSVEALAKKLGKKLWTIVLSHREPTDQGGLPALVEHKGEQVVRLIPPHWAREIIAADGGIVFFDEITAATPQVMNSALRIIQEGIVGDGVYLPKTTSFILAGNPAHSNVGASELTAGIANRICHVAWKPSYARWKSGMLEDFGEDELDAVSKMRKLVVDFLDTDPTLAHAFPQDPAEQGGAWPSFRSWDITAHALAVAQRDGHDVTSVVARSLVGGLVGTAAQTLFSTFLSTRGIPSIKALLADPTGVKIPTRQDMITSMLDLLVQHVGDGTHDDATFQAAWTVVGRVLDMPAVASLAIPACRGLAKHTPPSVDSSPRTPYGRALKTAGKHLKGSSTDFGRK